MEQEGLLINGYVDRETNNIMMKVIDVLIFMVNRQI